MTCHGGFSLLEILVAFAIAATALALLYQIQIRAATAAILAGEYAEAVVIAESRLQAAGIDGTADGGENYGQENKYQWTVQEEEYPDISEFESRLRLKKIVVEVSWQNRGHTRAVVLQTIKPAFNSLF